MTVIHAAHTWHTNGARREREKYVRVGSSEAMASNRTHLVVCEHRAGGS